jgi:hypothetical protein
MPEDTAAKILYYLLPSRSTATLPANVSRNEKAPAREFPMTAQIGR